MNLYQSLAKASIPKVKFGNNASNSNGSSRNLSISDIMQKDPDIVDAVSKAKTANNSNKLEDLLSPIQPPTSKQLEKRRKRVFDDDDDDDDDNDNDNDGKQEIEEEQSRRKISIPHKIVSASASASASKRKDVIKIDNSFNNSNILKEAVAIETTEKKKKKKKLNTIDDENHHHHHHQRVDEELEKKYKLKLAKMEEDLKLLEARCEILNKDKQEMEKSNKKSMKKIEEKYKTSKQTIEKLTKEKEEISISVEETKKPLLDEISALKQSQSSLNDTVDTLRKENNDLQIARSKAIRITTFLQNLTGIKCIDTNVIEDQEQFVQIQSASNGNSIEFSLVFNEEDEEIEYVPKKISISPSTSNNNNGKQQSSCQYEWLEENIFFECDQLPLFINRVLRAVHEGK